MAKRLLANYNGQEMYLDEVKVSPLDRAYLFGDAIYEVMRVYQGKIWLADQHFERMLNNLRSIHIECDFAAVKKHTLKTLENSGVENGTVYIQVSRGEAPRSHAFPPPGTPANVLIWVDHFEDNKMNESWKNGVSVITHSDIRWARCDIKSVNLLGNSIARQKAIEKGCYEAIFVDANNIVTEATSSNVFGIKSGELITAPKGKETLPGATREFLFGLTKELNISVKEDFITHEALYNLDELFLSGTVTEIMPVVKVDDKAIADGRPGNLTMKIQKMFIERTRR